MRLSEKSQEKFLEKFKLLIGEKHYWHKQHTYRLFAGTSPTGITQIQQLFNDAAVLEKVPSEIKIGMLADIYYIVLNRPADSNLRAGGTITL